MSSLDAKLTIAYIYSDAWGHKHVYPCIPSESQQNKMHFNELYPSFII
jgi:hypothetical protein